MEESIKYVCACCGKEHEEWPALAFSSPDNYECLSEEDKQTIAELDSDFCVIRHTHQVDRFIRCTLTQKVNDYCEDLEYGLWVSLSEKSFTDYSDNFKNENHLTKYFGWLCNDIPGYDFNESIPTTVFTRIGNQRPQIVPHQDFDHPFVHDYYNGITKEDAEKRIREMLNRTNNTKSDVGTPNKKRWWKFWKRNSMMLIVLFFIFFSTKAFCNDTLYFKLSNPWNTVKDPNGGYLRKCLKENDYYHVWDYNQTNILVTESFYLDTTFKRKLFCHKYFDEKKGYLEQTRCYDNGQLNGYMVDYSEKGDTASYSVLDHNNLIRSWSSQPEDASKTFTTIESVGDFPGGKTAWINYLSENLVYPKQLKQKISGQVVVKVHVDSTGVVNDVEVVKSLHPLLDAEVVRVIKNSPKWKPAIQNGKTVPMTFTQPVSF